MPSQLPTKWVADCKSVGNGEKALIYLGRYLYRGVLQESDILPCENGQVSFRYRDSQSGEMKVRTLPGADFLRLILQHVLPKGFRRSRNYGFLYVSYPQLDVYKRQVLNDGLDAAATRRKHQERRRHVMFTNTSSLLWS